MEVRSKDFNITKNLICDALCVVCRRTWEEWVDKTVCHSNRSWQVNQLEDECSSYLCRDVGTNTALSLGVLRYLGGFVNLNWDYLYG